MNASSEPAGAPQVQAVAGYKPSGKIGPLALPLLLVSLLVLAPVAAFLYVKTGHFGGALFSSVWVLVITAALLGAVVGAALYPAIQWGHVRHVPFAVTFGLLAGALAFPLAMGFEALQHRDEIQAALQKQGGAAAELTPVQTAQVYWQAHAEGGQEVTGKRGRGANISGSMFWALVGIEWLLTTLTAGVVAILWTNRRYSEAAGRWCVSKTVDTVLPQHLPELIAAGNADDWPRFAAIANQSKDPEFKEFKPQVTVHYLPGVPGGVLEIRAIADPKKPVTTVFERELTNEEIKVIWPGFPGPGGASGVYDIKPDESQPS
ncbi:MAG: hypothetical protein M3347_08550 [Armatimonadota bacterium]|nr:hypothetical protein [Armatimonadota bacterium]